MEEMASPVGLAMMRDVVAARSVSSASNATSQCATLVAAQVEVITERAAARQQSAPSVEAVMDGVVAPIIYRALFGPELPSQEQLRKLVQQCVER
jgi:hypothetical protein